MTAAHPGAAEEDGMGETVECEKVIYVINLNGHDVECGICGEWGDHRHAVGWYCGPVRQDIGEPVPEWGPDAIAAGRTVCRPCHDAFYGADHA